MHDHKRKGLWLLISMMAVSTLSLAAPVAPAPIQDPASQQIQTINTQIQAQLTQLQAAQE